MLGKTASFTAAQIVELKRRSQTDLFFLAKDILGKDGYTEFTHRTVCDFFVKKDPTIPTFRQFAETYQQAHDHLCLLPRKSYKSTTKVVDNVQWLINYPDIRIIVITATNPLATAFNEEFRSYFVVKGGERDKALNRVVGGNPTIFQQLFPEFSITEDECLGAFISPARKNWYKEPTIGALSMESAGAGWACDIVDFDDCVNEKNTKTGTQLEQLEKSIAMYSKLKMNYGFRHIVGTRYHPLDPYGKLCESQNFHGYGEFENLELKYVCKPAWWLKGRPYLQPDYKAGIPEESTLDLYFPQDLPFRFLAKELREHPEVFFSQELNDPLEAAGIQFTEDLVRSTFIDHTQLPKDGEIYIGWDCAGTSGLGKDFSVGAVGLIDTKGEWWIIDLIRGKFNFTELPFQIVQSAHKYRPKGLCIEDIAGVKHMTWEMDRRAKELNIPLSVDWISLGQGHKGAKFDRMATMHPLFTSRRIHFLNTIQCLDEVIKEFQNIGNDKARNDIPDAVSRITTTYAHIAGAAGMPSEEDSKRAWREIQDKEFHDMVYGQGSYAEQEIPEPETPRWMCDPVTGLPM